MRNQVGFGKKVLTVLLVSGFAALMQACSATTGTSSPLVMGVRTAPPPGVHAFCAQGGVGCDAPATINLVRADVPASGGATAGPVRFNVLPQDQIARAGVALPQMASFTPAPPRAPTPTLAIAPMQEAPVPARVEVADALLPRIAEINRQINHRMEWRADIDVYGVEEYWTLPLSREGQRFGDCEDFVLEKRQRLLDLGVPAAALAIATGYSEATGHHAVLIVRTSSGDYVLDNTTPWILPWSESSYRWLRIQEGESLMTWRQIQTASLRP